MQRDKMIAIDDVVYLLGLVRDPRGSNRTDSYNVRCPFCGDRKYHMNINSGKNLYRCIRCSGDDRNLNSLDLYARVRTGTRFIPGVSGNGKELAKALREELYGTVSSNIPRKSENPEVQQKEFENIYPADDGRLNEVYSALLSLDYMRLSDEHRDNLLRRGLDEETIVRNGYKTFYPANTVLNVHKKTQSARDRYFSRKLSEIKDEYPKLSRKRDEDLVYGMLIANDLRGRGMKLNGIPGFFKLGRTWLFNADAGLVIPTRNVKGEIVCLQIRKDCVYPGGARYMTVSSSGLKCGVNNSISRIHFPLGNAFSFDGKLTENMKTIITEGPLKADAAVYLYKDAPASFIALQGVNNTRELPDIADMLLKHGITHVYNAFDMDKVCNANVWKAERTVTAMLKKKGIVSKPLFWDYEDYVCSYSEALKKFMAERGMQCREYGNGIVFVIKNTACLFEQDTGAYFEFREENPWKGEKGIDDYLLKVRKDRKKE